MPSEFHARSSLRSRLDLEVYYHYSSDWFPCILKDLSVTGAGLKMGATFLNGDKIRLKIVFRNQERVVEAVIVNANGTRFGVRFVEHPDQLDFLDTIVQAYQRPAPSRRS